MSEFKDVIENLFGEQITDSFCIQKRDAILSAAFRVFTTNGYHQTDAQKIADVANVSKGTVFRYFHNKDYLFWAVSIWAGESFLKLATPIVESDLDNLAKLKRLGEVWCDFFEKNIGFIELFSWQRSLFKGKIPDEAQDIIRCQFFEPFHKVVQAGVENGDFIVKDTELFAFSLSTSLNGALMTYCYTCHRIPLSEHIGATYVPLMQTLAKTKLTK
ncbi:MAG: TetR/AcrR family transcriptional regulator [Thermoguttaceae bacterium]